MKASYWQDHVLVHQVQLRANNKIHVSSWNVTIIFNLDGALKIPKYMYLTIYAITVCKYIYIYKYDRVYIYICVLPSFTFSTVFQTSEQKTHAAVISPFLFVSRPFLLACRIAINSSSTALRNPIFGSCGKIPRHGTLHTKPKTVFFLN